LPGLRLFPLLALLLPYSLSSPNADATNCAVVQIASEAKKYLRNQFPMLSEHLI
jgi:hypothetical protein